MYHFGNARQRDETMKEICDRIFERVNARFVGRGTEENPIPIAEYEAAVQEEVAAYNRSVTH